VGGGYVCRGVVGIRVSLPAQTSLLLHWPSDTSSPPHAVLGPGLG
jgi:hypothetical protein